MIGFIVKQVKGIGRKVMPFIIPEEYKEMKHPEYAYLDVLKDILATGEHRPDRTGVGTISKFGLQMRFDLTKGFPAITTKKLAWKSVVSELLWFISGSGDERKLKEILHGDSTSDKKTIWSDNAESPYWRTKSKFKGDLGRVYGVQWRTWRAPVFGANKMGLRHVDQLQDLINSLTNDPYSRRHIITAWNPGELDAMALPPCHMMSQFYITTDGKLNCQMYQRSADMFLGVPFNIASYALLTHMLAHVCNLYVGELVITFGDAHIYENHVDQVKEQLERKPLDLPNIVLNADVQNINKFTMQDIELTDYQSWDAIKADMAV
jgi:thymidylate synthase